MEIISGREHKNAGEWILHESLSPAYYILSRPFIGVLEVTIIPMLGYCSKNAPRQADEPAGESLL